MSWENLPDDSRVELVAAEPLVGSDRTKAFDSSALTFLPADERSNKLFLVLRMSLQERVKSWKAMQLEPLFHDVAPKDLATFHIRTSFRCVVVVMRR